MEITSNTYYVLYCKRGYSKTLIKGSQIIGTAKKFAKSISELLRNFDVSLATEAQIVLYAKKERLNDSPKI